MRYVSIVLLTVFTGLACDYNITAPSPSISVNNTNINNNTNTVDLPPITSPTVPPSNGSPSAPDVMLPIPVGSEGIAKAVADANPTLISKSCQATDGVNAWKFIDLLVGTLRVQDVRWGYVCKDSSCSAFSQDTVGYRATSDEIGTWVIDVIGNHCGLSATPVLNPNFTWNVVGFESSRPWKAIR